ncbi:flavin reductase family protein [Propionivibrio limicola]|uniref:flavin reductase family protein n=1 Tax=Propionivibrio limicola TaxID=167645 RepID=UPI001291B9F6|nr:flavin reductase family protein [Propionivibrio limicola]
MDSNGKHQNSQSNEQENKDALRREFRAALGAFATGVTVLTALDDGGQPIGVTISSFNSVSLDPPLILWSLDVNSPNLEAFRGARHYAVNVLAADQQPLSDRFASRREKRFDDLPWNPGLSGAPLFAGCCAWFECVSEAHYPGGDHLIFVGRVERFSLGEAEAPLVFHQGRYRRLDAA